jgi:hypothetical protein
MLVSCISKYTLKNIDDINYLKELFIEPVKYLNYFKSNPNYHLRIGEYFREYDYKNNVTDFSIDLVPAGFIKVFYGQRITDELIVELQKIADHFGAKVLASIDFEYPKSKIITAQKRLAKKNKQIEIEYQKESFGFNNMWLAINENLVKVKEFYKLEGEEKEWNEALELMYNCEGILMYEFRGWTFLAGQNIETLFDCKEKGENKIEKFHVEKLKDWGKSFYDIQLYMHYDRSMFFNAFYRILNGEIVYGEYHTESYQKKYGKLPKNLKDLPDNKAYTIASEWSYDPDYLRFCPELDDVKAWIVETRKF